MPQAVSEMVQKVNQPPLPRDSSLTAPTVMKLVPSVAVRISTNRAGEETEARFLAAHLLHSMNHDEFFTDVHMHERTMTNATPRLLRTSQFAT